MCRRVASSATALAPFSQNSAVCRCPGAGSGQAQPWQSKPSTWLSLSSVVRRPAHAHLLDRSLHRHRHRGGAGRMVLGVTDGELVLVDVAGRRASGSCHHPVSWHAPGGTRPRRRAVEWHVRVLSSAAYEGLCSARSQRGPALARLTHVALTVPIEGALHEQHRASRRVDSAARRADTPDRRADASAAGPEPDASVPPPPANPAARSLRPRRLRPVPRPQLQAPPRSRTAPASPATCWTASWPG